VSAIRHKAQNSHLFKQHTLSEVPLLQRALRHFPRLQGLDRAIQQAGLTWTVSKLLLGCAAIGTLAFMVVTSGGHQPALVGALAAAAAACLPLLYVRRKRRRRLAKIEQQLPDALDLMARALRAGHAFSSGLKMAGEEMAEPIAGELRNVHEEVNFGVSLEQALTHLSERVPITDLRYFVVAVLIQRDSGGNLTEILDNLSRLIRERAKLMGRIKVLSAEGRMSAWILLVLPFALGAAMNLVNPKFMSPLWTDPMGISILKYMLTLMALGVLVLRHIVRIRV
jgi:tight adherence protein B